VVANGAFPSLLLVDQVALKLSVFEKRVCLIVDAAEAAKAIMRIFAGHHREVDDDG